tara:strand:- start:2531 stop:2698 length:168 start_codon:yes stop_codon:yes gene_type:complete
MSKSSIIIIIYIIGIIFGAFVLGVWSAETGPKALLGALWTAIFLISIYYSEKKKD